MNRYLLAIAISLVTLVACQEQPKESGSESLKTTISGKLDNTAIASITLERIANDFASAEQIESLAAKADGEFSFSLDIPADAPATYYQLNLGEEHTPVKLIVAAGDNIKVDVEAVDGFYTQYSVEGSEESKLICEFNDLYFADVNHFVTTFEQEPSKSGAIARKPIQAQVGFVTKYANRLAAIYALNEDFYGVQGINMIHIEMVRDGIEQSYPSSPYIEILNREIELNNMITNAEESVYFDITLTDINRKPHTLSSFEGKVTLLCFWSIYEPFSTPFIGEFKQIYKRYHDKGLEAYFVSTDSNRSNWIKSVMEQQHPWTSVFGFDNPTVFMAYNVEVTPTIYIIDRKGDIMRYPLVTSDMKELERVIKQRL